MKLASVFILLVVASGALAAQPKKVEVFPIGYSDTPLISPTDKWKVHDFDRPRPAVVRPGRTAADAPADAIVLFDGKNTDQFVGKNGVPCPWKIENGELIVNGGDVWSKLPFASCQLHLEWKTFPNTEGNSQKKGNAGVFFRFIRKVSSFE